MAKRPKNELPDAAKNFMVCCFARFMSPTQVAEAVSEQFNVTVDKRQAQHYDPTKSSGAQLGKARKALFEQTRERFLKELEDIPIANRAMRLQQLQVHYSTMIARGNVGGALRVLEQASKEAGNFHSNEKHVHHSGHVKVEEVSEDEMRRGLAAAIATALEEMRTEAAGVTKH